MWYLTMKIKININKIINFFMIMFIIFISGTAIYSIEQFQKLRSITIIILICLLLIYPSGKLKLKQKSKKGLIILIFGIEVFFSICFINFPSGGIGIITKIIMLILLYIHCSNEENRNDIMNYLYNIIIFLSIIALIFFVIINIFKISLPYLMVGNGFYKSYGFLFFTQDGYLEKFGPIVYYRLQGIFWEPGVYAVYLIFSLYHYIFKVKKKRKWEFWLLVICLILTKSTTGLIVGIILLGVCILKKMRSFSAKIFIVIPIGIGSILIISYLWLQKRNSTISPSYNLRMHDMITSFKVWKNNIIFGTGYNNTSEFEVYGRFGNSNGLLNWCMTMGIIGLIAVILPFFYNCFLGSKEEKMDYIVLLTLFILLNMTEPIITTPLMILYLANSYIDMLRKEGKNEKFI